MEVLIILDEVLEKVSNGSKLLDGVFINLILGRGISNITPDGNNLFSCVAYFHKSIYQCPAFALTLCLGSPTKTILLTLK